MSAVSQHQKRKRHLRRPNRITTAAGGDENGANLREAAYQANLLNQYEWRGVPGMVDVLGIVLATNTVTVNGAAPYRKGEYFRKELAVTNTTAPVWQQLSPLNTFMWGTDLSGTMQGADGVGGVLAVTVHSGPETGACFYCYDGNGNVVALVNAADGTAAAQYEYGELLRERQMSNVEMTLMFAQLILRPSRRYTKTYILKLKCRDERWREETLATWKWGVDISLQTYEWRVRVVAPTRDFLDRL